MWTGNEKLDKLRSKAATEPSGVIKVSIEELNEILPIKDSIPLDKPVKPEIADIKENLLNFKQKLYKAQANMLKEFKPKEHQVILDFIATINEKDIE